MAFNQISGALGSGPLSWVRSDLGLFEFGLSEVVMSGISRSWENSAQRLEKIESSLLDAEAKENEAIVRIALIKEELAIIEMWETEMSSSFKQDNASFHTIRGAIQEFKREFDKHKAAPIDEEMLRNFEDFGITFDFCSKSFGGSRPFV